MSPTLRRLTVLTWLLPLLALGSLLPAQEKDAEVVPQAITIEITGTIDNSTVARVHRGVKDAVRRGIRYLILNIKSGGGRLDSMEKVHEELRVLRQTEVSTVAFVEGEAYSAAALIAITCDRMFMRDQAKIGAMTPIEFNPLTGTVQNIASDARAKAISAVQAMLLAAVENTPRDTKRNRMLFRAMVDPDLRVYKVSYKQDGLLEDGVIVDQAGLDALKENRDIEILGAPEAFDAPLTLTTQQVLDLDLAEAQVTSINDVVRNLGLEMEQLGELSETTGDRFVDVLNTMREVLFVLGFILLLIELKTPGVALPGVLGVMMFGFAFYGAYQVGLASWFEITLFFAGIGLLAMEIFLFPGTIISGALGCLFVFSGLILAQQSFFLPENERQSNLMFGNIMEFGVIMVIVLLAIWLIYANLHRIPLLRTAIQQAPVTHEAGTGTGDDYNEKLARLVGKIGLLACDLRPTGWLQIADEKFDVVSEGQFIDRGEYAKVIEVRGNRVVVERCDPPPGASAGNPANPESGAADWSILVFLVILGFALVIAEVFLVSFGVLGILSGVCLCTAVFFGFTYYDPWVGWLLVGVCGVGVPLTMRFAFQVLPKTRLGKELYLRGMKHDEVSGAAEEEGLHSFLNKTGVALCDLRPSGYAQIDGRRVDVVTRGELLAKDTPLKVIKVESNQVFVANENEPSPS